MEQDKLSDQVLINVEVPTVSGQFEEVLAQIDGSSAGERHLEAGPALPTTWHITHKHTLTVVTLSSELRKIIIT